MADMSTSPIYAHVEGSCQLLSMPDSPPDSVSTFYADSSCLTQLPYKATSFLNYCQNNLLAGKETFIGNANAWVDDSTNRYAGLGKNSRWTLSHGARFDYWAIPLNGNRRPFVKKVEYKNVNSCALEMRIFKKDINEENLKPLIFIHGGAWKFRSFGAIGVEAAVSHFTERGYVVFAPYYRLMGNSDGPTECQETLGEDIVTDVEAAFEWVQQHGTDLGVTPGPITLVGQSAGAHLSAWLGLHETYSADVRKSLLFYPPIDLESFIMGTAPGGIYDTVENEMGKSLVSEFLTGQSNLEMMIDRDNLPLFALQNGMPRRVQEGESFAPTFMIHGNMDDLVPVESSTRMCDALAGLPFGSTSADGGDYPCGVDSKLSVIDGADHMFDMKCMTEGIDPELLKNLQSHVPGFETGAACPAGSSAGAAHVRRAIEDAFIWLD
ncbi:MAG: alpha/beta hydrolase [Candidatus Polarisedimenticolaceae bacterium]|nr:alpha/beta hydrolase [Candidatus Polarisedimenticolaceae bacterium]